MRTPITGLLRFAARARRGLAISGLVLLGASVTPCAMAMNLAHSCVHCPPQIEDPGNRHHGHHGDEAPAGCDSLRAPCGESADINADARPAQPKAKDCPELPALPAPGIADTGFLPVADRFPAVDPPLRRYSSRAIHLLNCVFLD